MNWQGVFFTAAATLGVIGCVSLFTLKSRPSQLGLPEPPPAPDNVYGVDAGHGPISLGRLLGPLFGSFTFWLVCLMNVGLTLIRETFNLWSPTYLKEVVKLETGDAAMASLVFPLVGAAAGLLAGWLVDRLNGRYSLVALSSLVLLIAVLALTSRGCRWKGKRGWRCYSLASQRSFSLRRTHSVPVCWR